LPDPRSARTVQHTQQVPPEPRALFDVHMYEEILKQNVPPFLVAVGQPGFVLLVDLLQSALVFSRGASEEAELQDYSFIWRPAIEDHAQNLELHIRHFLVSAVRDAAGLLFTRGLMLLTDIVFILEGRPWPIFRRIALHVLREHSEVARALVEAQLVNRA